MANYYEKARTNYFKVKDEAAFKEFLSNFNHGIDFVPQEETGMCALLFDEESGIPSFYYDENDDEVEVDFIQEVASHLTDDSILVVMGVGSEKMRYLTGYAVAANSKGKEIRISINEIYDLAKKTFGVKEITPAEY